uniref:NADH-ubiquinone oxidoreductase chain 2 n=1 Tax=Succinea putris TaxID=145427 RepID=G8HSH4_9EUPU|nr:NADH dehydrogenase subunit 2 [Succinea putris]AEQ93918.1 NADH dehydrogenase subunit 2 [Succinea putris]
MKVFSYFNFFMMFLLPLMSLTSSDWILSWFYMEIMLMFFYSFFFKLNQNLMLNFASMKYFIIQGMTSLLLLVAGLSIFYHNMNNMMLLMFFLGLLIKLGVFPFHFWVIPILNNMNNMMLFMLLYMMKIIPLSFLNMTLVEFFNNDSDLLLMLVILVSLFTMFIGSLMGNNFSSFNLMLGGSSINHSGWFMFSICLGLLWFYFIIYGIILLFLLLSVSYYNNMTIFLSLIGLSGLPPFGLFFAKLKILTSMIMNKYFFIILMLIVLSIISLKFYLKFGFFYFLKVKINNIFNNWLCMSFLTVNSMILMLFITNFFYSLTKKASNF